MAGPHVVAVINTSPDTVNLLRTALTQAGLVVVSGYTYDIREGRLDLDTFMELHAPHAVVYDVAPPYEENWRLFEHLRRRPAMQGAQFVITTTNTRHVQDLAGRDEKIYEVVGKPLDLGEIVQAVREAVRVRPTR